MSKNFKTKLLYKQLGALIVGMVSTCLILNSTLLTSNYQAKTSTDLQNSSFLFISPIYIDDLSASDWESYKSASVAWLSGNGTIYDPYIIKDVFIDGQESDSCITIKNSNAYFIIKNSTFYSSNAGTPPDYEAGIRLENVSNGFLYQNTFFDNYRGITLRCSQVNISESMFYDNNYGICVYESNKNKIYWNMISNNFEYGIYFNMADNNSINENIINENDKGIFLNNSDLNLILDNYIENNTEGIYFNLNNQYNSISRNYIRYNTKSGVNITDNGNINNMIFNNIFVDNAIQGEDNNEMDDNQWDYNNLGNYWSDHDNYDTDGDNLADEVYEIQGTFGIIDEFPLMTANPYDVSELDFDSPIFIDGSATGVDAHNWEWAETQYWCHFKNGIYYIENVSIDAGGEGSCIRIQNSRVNYVIRNCFLTNSDDGSYPYYDAAINLINVCNGMMFNNSIVKNYFGIMLSYGSENNTILSNNIFDNDLYGVYIKKSHNNTISGNNISNIVGTRQNYGLIAYDSNRLIVINNNMSNNFDCAIKLNNCSQVTLKNNKIEEGGMEILGELDVLRTYNIDDSNEVNNKPIYYYIDKNGLNSENFSNAGQIFLINCSDSILSGLIISRVQTAVYMCSCLNNTISGNDLTATYAFGAAVYLENCENNTISGNNVTNTNIYYGWTGSAIELIYSDNNTIHNNNGTSAGSVISITHSSNNMVSFNTMNDIYWGISLYNSNNNTIFKNIVNYKDIDSSPSIAIGIQIRDNCEYNKIKNNTISGNDLSVRQECSWIQLENNCNNELSGNNIIGIGGTGIYLLFCNDTTISNNEINNTGINIHIWSSYNAILTENKMNHWGIRVDGYGAKYASMKSHIIDSTNKVRGKNVYYYVNEIELQAINFYNAGQVYLINCMNSEIVGLNISLVISAILLYRCTNISFYSNNISDNREYGIILIDSNNNTIKGNNVERNRYDGINLDNCSYNVIWLNRFNENNLGRSYYDRDAEDRDGNNNQWDNGSVGNWWSNYDGPDSLAPYGIGDDPYSIPGNSGSFDWFPLVNYPLQANFSVNLTSTVKDAWIQFNYTGSGGIGPLDYFWDFDDGYYSTDANPVHQYQAVGIYDVNLTVIDKERKVSTKVTQLFIDVDTQPSAWFTTNTTWINTSQCVEFTYTGCGGDGQINYLWTFGDGQNSIDPNPIHQYMIGGNFTVNLKVSDEDGDVDFNITYIYVNSKPSPNFQANFTDIKELDCINFAFTGSSGNEIIEYFWTFGDGQNSTDPNPVHQYETAGTYTVTLRVTDYDGDVVIEIKLDYIRVTVATTPEQDSDDSSVPEPIPDIESGQNEENLIMIGIIGFIGFGTLVSIALIAIVLKRK